LRTLLITTKAVRVSLLDDTARVESLTVLSRFRTDFYDCLAARADAMFELADAPLRADGAVSSLVDLTLTPEHRRGHGALYDALNCEKVRRDRLPAVLAGLPLPKTTNGRIVLAVDVSPWLRPDAPTSAERLFCHVYGRAKNQPQLIPGWPYSLVAALEPGRTWWTAVLDAVRLGPTDDATAVTAGQLRAVVARLAQAGHWHDGDPDIPGRHGRRLRRHPAGVRPGRPARRAAWQDPLRPGPTAATAAQAARDQWPPTQARSRVRPGHAQHLARAAAHHDHRHHPLRHRDGQQLGPAAPTAHPPYLLD
jgi:hypothetical protein